MKKNDEKHVIDEKYEETMRENMKKNIKMEKNILKIVILWLDIQVKNNKTKGNISKLLSNQ